MDNTDNIKIVDFEILTKFDINDIPPKHISLSKPVVCFNNLNEWIIIDLNQFLKTPIIWTEIYSEDKIINVSIIVCPITLRCAVFEGKFKSKYYKDDRLILENEEKSLIPIDLNIALDNEYNLELNKRYQLYVQTLKNALIDYYDIKYLHPKNLAKKYVIRKNYLTDKSDEFGNIIESEKFHPKTLVHLIQYNSKENKKKITIIIGKDSKLLEINGYDNKKSGFDYYLLKYENEIIEKESFIIPMLYYKAIEIYKNSKIIIL
jgi:hypothetical protein